MEFLLWFTDVSEFSRMLVSSILTAFFLCFLFKQYNQFRKKHNVSNQTTQTPNHQRQSIQTQIHESKSEVSNTATQTFDEDFWMSSSAEDNCDEYCDICEIMRQAIKYCTQCKQYLCIQCLKVHRQIRVTKDHEIISCAKKLRNRHLALWSTNNLTKTVENLTGFSNTENKTGIRFVSQVISVQPINTYTKDVYIRLIDAKDNKLASENTISIENLAIRMIIEDTFEKLFYFVTGNELTYFTFPRYKRVCKTENDMKTATIVFTTPGHCHGITKFDNGLALVHDQDGSFATPKWQIHVYTFDGVLKQQILYDKEKQALFERPEYLSANTEETIMYATDTGKNVLYAFDTAGTILFIFQSKVMASPKGISTDYEGNIYIACKGRILQLHKNGVKYRTILHMEKGKENKYVEDVYFDKANTQLAVIEDFKHGSVFKFLSD